MKKFIFFFLFVSLILTKAIAQNGWFLQTSGTTNDLWGVSFTDPITGTVVGSGNTILRTTNGGTNWAAQTSSSTNAFLGVSFTDANNGTAVGYDLNGTILHTTNGGSTWVRQNNVVSAYFYGVSFTDANNGTAVGSSGQILHTTNGGITWVSQTSGTGELLTGVSFTDANNGTTVGYYSTILHTTNGGTTWVNQLNPLSGTTNYPYGVSFTDANNGTVVGSGGIILRTTNGGITWLSQSSGVGSLNGVSFIDANNGWAVGNWGILIHTTNGGSTWISQPNPLTGTTTKNLNGVCFTDANNGWAVGSGGIILRTINGGVPVELISFTTLVIGNNVTLNWKTATEINNKGFEVQKNINNNWIDLGFVNGNGTTTEPKEYSYIDNNAGIGKIVYRLKQIDYNGSSKYSNEVEINITPTEFGLSQNYPNPFNPLTAISYQLSAVSQTTLKVYDILGKEVATLVNEVQQAGEYKVNFNGSNLPSGIYFYQLHAGNFVETKKMLLLK